MHAIEQTPEHNVLHEYDQEIVAKKNAEKQQNKNEGE